VDIVYWFSDAPSPFRWYPSRRPLDDGDVVGMLLADPSRPEPLPDLRYEMELRLSNPPEAGVHDVASLLDNIHHHVAGRVLPSVLNIS